MLLCGRVCSLKVAICVKFDVLHLQFKSWNGYSLYALLICRYVHCSVHRTWWLHYFAQVALLCANVHNVTQCPRIVSDTLVAGRWVHCTGTGIASAQATRRGTDFWQGIYIMCNCTSSQRASERRQGDERVFDEEMVTISGGLSFAIYSYFHLSNCCETQ